VTGNKQVIEPNYSFLSLFTGAGGLDLGFETQGFRLLEAVEINPWCVKTLKQNRPQWKVSPRDIHQYEPNVSESPDVLLAGFPCQGFSLGGKRDESDGRNLLYQQVLRIANITRPKVVVMENVLNLGRMKFPGTNQPFAAKIATELEQLGYTVIYDIFKVCYYGTPQTRRRFVFIAFQDKPPLGYHLPPPSSSTVIKPFIYQLGQDTSISLFNHNPMWGFHSRVHVETGEPFSESEEAVPVRLSRTASDGCPIRSFNSPFPAVDTATVWGWAQGNVRAQRVVKDRSKEKFVRNPNSQVKLWRIAASRLRSFTHREYARLQTFPDDWVFCGASKRDIQLQIGNAVPVSFAECLARNVRLALEAMEKGRDFMD